MKTGRRGFFFIIIIQEFEFGGLIFKSRPGFPTAKVKVCESISASTPFSHVKQNASSFFIPHTVVKTEEENSDHPGPKAGFYVT